MMSIKTHIIETSKARVLVANLPDDLLGAYKVPQGNWQLLGKLADVSEDDWKKIFVPHYKEKCAYKDYNDVGYYFRTATQSGLSLIEACVKLKNNKPHPSDIEPTNRNHFDYLEKEWRVEQSQVFTNPVLFVEFKN